MDCPLDAPRPPSTGRITPLTKRASSLASKAITPATSSGVAARPIGEAITEGSLHRFHFLQVSRGVGGGETRCHGVDAHAPRAVLQRQGTREVGDRSFGRVVGTHAPVSAQTRRGGKVDDGTLRFQKVRQGFTRPEEDAVQICAHDPAPVLRGGLRERAKDREARVVDQHVQLAEPGISV